MREWAEITRKQVQEKLPIERGDGAFTLCSYHWIMNTHNKMLLFHVYNALEQHQVQNSFLCIAFFNPGINLQHYELEISRDDILA